MLNSDDMVNTMAQSHFCAYLYFPSSSSCCTRLTIYEMPLHIHMKLVFGKHISIWHAALNFEFYHHYHQLNCYYYFIFKLYHFLQRQFMSFYRFFYVRENWKKNHFKNWCRLDIMWKYKCFPSLSIKSLNILNGLGSTRRKPPVSTNSQSHIFSIPKPTHHMPFSQVQPEIAIVLFLITVAFNKPLRTNDYFCCCGSWKIDNSKSVTC